MDSAEKIIDHVSVKLRGCNHVIVIMGENILVLGHLWGAPSMGPKTSFKIPAHPSASQSLQNREMPLSSKEEVMGLERPTKSPVTLGEGEGRRGRRGRERGWGAMPGEPGIRPRGCG